MKIKKYKHLLKLKLIHQNFTMRLWLFVLLGLGVILCQTGCKSEYTRYVETEMAKGIRNDSLIFGMSIGQTRQDFFNRCLELNKQHIITDGDAVNAKYVESLDSLGDNSKKKEMLFYGLFDDKTNIMYGMRLTFSYLGWTLWNEEFHSDKLIWDVRDKLMKDYGGNSFIEVELNGDAFKSLVKIDGNRRIIIVPKNKKDVYVKIEDLNYVLNQKKIKHES
jgi:hypothetical protein